jgi:hypothetical protein
LGTSYAICVSIPDLYRVGVVKNEEMKKLFLWEKVAGNESRIMFIVIFLSRRKEHEDDDRCRESRKESIKGKTTSKRFTLLLIINTERRFLERKR